QAAGVSSAASAALVIPRIPAAPAIAARPCRILQSRLMSPPRPMNEQLADTKDRAHDGSKTQSYREEQTNVTDDLPLRRLAVDDPGVFEPRGACTIAIERALFDGTLQHRTSRSVGSDARKAGRIADGAKSAALRV